MELQELNPFFRELLEKLPIARRSLRKIYYISHGRNAWNSTWVRKYKDGCLHTTLQSAKQAAEKWRVSGSVFYIEQVPALVLSTDGPYSIIITQINEDWPLKDYRPNGNLYQNRGQSLIDPGRRWARARIQSIGKGSTLGCAIDSFHTRSEYWDGPGVDMCHVMRYAEDASLLEKYKDSECNRLKSFAIGTQYSLAWEGHASTRSSKAIRRILATRPSRKATY